MGLLWPAHAGAVLVYERHASGQVVVARDGGRGAHVIAKGLSPLVAPNGRSVLFYRKTGLWLAGIDGRHARRLLRNAYLDLDNPARSWSPDSRYVLAGDHDSGATFLVDLRRRTTRVYHDGRAFTYTGASFGRRSRRIVFEVQEIHAPSELWLRDLHDHSLLHVADGTSPLWGPGGLAFDAVDGIRLKRRLKKPASLLLPRPRREYISPIDWSSDGDVLLVGTGRDQFERRAVFVSVPGGRSKTVPGRFRLAALSADGRLALAETEGDVVQIDKRGKVRALAREARSPSWTK